MAAYSDGGSSAYLANGTYAADFYGNVNVSGTLTKSGGSFKIDDPLDPANKYLLHSFVESPDMKNIYDGVVTLDANGQAAVTLPAWFGTLNGIFATNSLPSAPGPQPLHRLGDFEQRIQDCGRRPGAKVSWQVTGIRQDPWANAHRIPVEEFKPVRERGSTWRPNYMANLRRRAFGRPGTR